MPPFMNQTLTTKKIFLSIELLALFQYFYHNRKQTTFYHNGLYAQRSQIKYFYTHFFVELMWKNNIVVKSRNLLGIKPVRLDVSLCLKLL